MKTVIVEMLESDLDKLNKFKMVESHPAIVQFVKNHLLPTELDDDELAQLVSVCKNAVNLNQSFSGVEYSVHTEYDRDDETELWNQLTMTKLVKECGITDIKTSDLLTAIEQYEF